MNWTDEDYEFAEQPIEVAEKPTNEHAEAIRQLIANRLKEDTKKGAK